MKEYPQVSGHAKIKTSPKMAEVADKACWDRDITDPICSRDIDPCWQPHAEAITLQECGHPDPTGNKSLKEATIRKRPSCK